MDCLQEETQPRSGEITMARHCKAQDQQRTSAQREIPQRSAEVRGTWVRSRG